MPHEHAATDERLSLPGVLPRESAGPGTRRDSSDDRRGRRAARSQYRVAVVAVVVVATTAATVLFGGYRPWHVGSRAPAFQESVTVPYWNLAAGSQALVAHQRVVTGASPWIYAVDDRGGVISQTPVTSTGRVSDALARLEKAGIPLMPTVSNAWAGSWSRERVARIIDDPGLRARHVKALVDLASQHGFDGVDIDYEEMLAQDRAAFTAFIQQLATALHAKHKKLAVDVFAKTTNRGYDQRNVAQDYAALGAAADQIRIMAYDWHWSSSAAGPVAPVDWVGSVLRYAVTQIPRGKIILGVPTYGYDWVGTSGQLVSWVQAFELSRRHKAVVHWDNQFQSPWFTYTSATGRRHTVWFENAYSSSAKIALARSMRVGGVYLWLVGNEDDLIWKQLGPSGSASATAGGRT